MTSPTLLTPTNGAQLDTLIPTFWWDNGIIQMQIVIRIQIAADPHNGCKSQIILWQSSCCWTSELQFFQQLLARHQHTIGKHILCAMGESRPILRFRSFATGSGGIILPPPTLKTPANGTVLTNNAATLEWNPVGGARRIFVSYRPTGENWYSWRITTATQEDYSYLDANTTYEWW